MNEYKETSWKATVGIQSTHVFHLVLMVQMKNKWDDMKVFPQKDTARSTDWLWEEYFQVFGLNK